MTFKSSPPTQKSFLAKITDGLHALDKAAHSDPLTALYGRVNMIETRLKELEVAAVAKNVKTR